MDLIFQAKNMNVSIFPNSKISFQNLTAGILTMIAL